MQRKILSFIIFLIFLSFTNTITAYAENKTVIKVGYPIQGRLTEKDSEGNYFGYSVDYLNEIKKYTGWDYEFVEVEGTLNEQLTTLLEMLKNGDIDLLGAVKYYESLAEFYDYPSYNYGLAYTTLAVKQEDSRWLSNDFQNWNGIKVGIYPGQKKRAQELEKFANINGFTYQIVEIDTYDELLEELFNGNIDAILQVDISINRKLKSIAKFSPEPYYFATTKGNQEVINKLNSALAKIDSSNPYLQSVLYDKYFNINNQFAISEENKEYIKSLGTINVMLIDGNAPIQYYDEEPKGIAISYLEKLKQETGLSYKVIVAKDYNDCIKKKSKYDIDLFVGVPTNSNLISEFDLTLSIPYLESRSIYVSNKESKMKRSDEEHFIYNISDCLNKMNKNECEAAYLDSYCTNFYLQKKAKYKNIKLDYSDSSLLQYSMGIVDKDNNSYLLSIINSFINSISAEENQEIIYNNTIIHIKYPLIDFIKTHSMHIIVFALLLFIVGILIYVRNIKIKNAMLDKIAVEHKRYIELSKLTNECLFEYNYAKDMFKIYNNKIIFDGTNLIENFMSYTRYDFLKDLIRSKKDDTRDFLLEEHNEKKWCRVILKVIKNDNGIVTYALGKLYDINEEIIKNKALLEKAKRDPLTNLYNRVAAEEQIELLLKKDCTKGILILLDIDNFKSVNDSLGHPVGDSLLVEFSQLLNRFFSKEDVTCRLGGDEFLIFLHSSMNEDSLSEKLDSFINQCNHSIFQKYSENVSISIGVAIVTDDVYMYEDLYKKADYAMYVAKFGGKNGFFISDGTECMRQECIHCKTYCKRREYLKKRLSNNGTDF